LTQALPQAPHAAAASPEPAMLARIWQLLEQVCDPEIPVISLLELGVVRDVRPSGQGWQVVITPTYSGCPAMSQMADDIVSTLAAAGVVAQVITQLAPAWSTDWISAEGRRKLREYGIAPPGSRPVSSSRTLRFMPPAPAAQDVPCPRCGSSLTQETSHFGSTACKAMYRCLDCREPFDYFKPY